VCVYVEGSWKLLIPVEKYGDMLYRLSVSMLRNKQDAEDSVQDTFMRYLDKKPKFNDEEHEKAWLLRVCINICKNKLRTIKRHEYVSMEDFVAYEFTYKDFTIFDAVSKLPEKYKTVVLLYYVEEYKVDEIAKILDISSSAVKKRLQRAREMLKVYEDDCN